MDIIIYSLIGVLTGGIIIYFIMRSKVKQRVFLDTELEKENSKLRQEYEFLRDEYVRIKA
ncbi:MAG: hypothetical protein E7167_02060 [Firmicutes bacterium]|nr:hypothetical protein [Bacillota bacterium]